MTTELKCTCGGSARYASGHYPDCPSIAASLLKSTNGPCTCAYGTVYWVASGHPRSVAEHAPDCPSLYPAQQEPDALTRLVRHIRTSTMHEVEKDAALSLISEAREEQRRAAIRAKNAGLEDAAARCAASCGAPEPCSCDEHFGAESFRAMKDTEP